MEGDHYQDHCCCCCSGGRGGGLAVGYHRDDALIPRRRETRLLRIAQLLVAGLLLLTAGSLALLFTAGFQKRCALEAGQQVTKELDSKSMDNSGTPEMLKLQGGGERPCAMLTAPQTRIYQGKRLNWESKSGIVCRGGFHCSDWELRVPVNGIYRVFLQITWRLEETCPSTELCLSSDVIAFRDSYQTYRVVMSMVDLVECRTPWKKSLYASRFVKLESNSRLHVNSSFPKLIAKDEHQVFFGAELIDSSSP